MPAPSARKIGIMLCRFLICGIHVGDRAHVGDPSWQVSCACAWSRTRRAHAGGGRTKRAPYPLPRHTPAPPPHPDTGIRLRAVVLLSAATYLRGEACAYVWGAGSVVIHSPCKYRPERFLKRIQLQIRLREDTDLFRQCTCDSRSEHIAYVCELTPQCV